MKTTSGSWISSETETYLAERTVIYLIYQILILAEMIQRNSKNTVLTELC